MTLRTEATFRDEFSKLTAGGLVLCGLFLRLK
jgi:hypothetical protein